MPFDVKQYATELAKAAGVADDKLQVALEVLSNEKVSKGFEEVAMMRSDYSRNMDGITKRNKELDDWYKKQVEVAAANQKVVDDTAAKLKQYEELYGAIDGGQGKPSAVDTSQFVDKKTFEETLAKQGQQYLSIVKTATRCASDYQARFGKALDVDALEKLALDSGLPLQAAYDKFIEPEVKAIENKSVEERLKKAREEGLQEGLSQKTNPTDPGTPAPNGFMANALKSAGASPTLSQSFIDAWSGAAAKK